MRPTRVSNPSSSENESFEQAEWGASFEAKLVREFKGFEPCLLAVSGGADSMAMLVAAARCRVAAEVATVDHGLRSTSAAEAEGVRQQGELVGLRSHVVTLALAPGAALEARARAARYDALRALAESRGLRFIATAHTATDQAETVLMRLGRGSSLRGATGVHARRADGVIRPVLWATRADTERYCGLHSVPVVHDPMNADRAFLRARVRHEVLPAFEAAFGPGGVQALGRFATFAAEDDAWLEAEAALALERAGVGGAALDRVAVLAAGLPIRRRLVARWLEAAGVTLDAHHLGDVLAALEERRTATLPGDRILTVTKALVRIEPAPPRLHGTSSSDDGRSEK